MGPFAGELHNATRFSAAVLAGSNNEAAARALVEFLVSAETAAYLKTKGFERERQERCGSCSGRRAAARKKLDPEKQRWPEQPGQRRQPLEQQRSGADEVGEPLALLGIEDRVQA